MKKKILWALAALALLPSQMMAQDTEKKSDFTGYVKASLVSHYMWRGIDMADISLQPEASVAWKGLSLKASGSTGLAKEDIDEIDVTLGYERWGFNIGVTDYWATAPDAENRYFLYDKDKTPHQLEANIGYTCKYGSIQAYTMFWGNDYKTNGDQAYSTFIELSVPFTFAGLDWDARVGVTPMESAGYTVVTPSEVDGMGIRNNYYFYGGKFTCNMVSLRSTKTLEFKNLKLPIFAEFHANPDLKTARFLVGIEVVAF